MGADTARAAPPTAGRIHASDAVRSALEALLAALEAAGTWMSADLQWRASEQGLTAYSLAAHGDKRSYLRWPLEALPRYQPGAVVLENDQLQPGQIPEETTAAQQRLLDAQLALLNALEASARWRATHPVLALPERSPLRQALAAMAAPDAPWQQDPELLRPAQASALCCASLLGRRLVAVAPRVDQDGTGEPSWHLAPLLDTLVADAEGEPLVINPRAVPPSVRLFARGGGQQPLRVRLAQLDALDAWLRDGVLDLSWPWLGSVPLTLRLPDGRPLRVARMRAGVLAHLPPPLQALRPYLPQVAVANEEVRLSKLLIPPPGAPLALRRVLGLLLGQLAPGLGSAEQQRWVRASEEQLLAENTAWWAARQGEAAALPAGALKDGCDALCARALAQLDAYRAPLATREAPGSAEAAP
ncbi:MULTISPECIES: hypothetical protein [Thiorhodovibrio]|uniref:hypothetical protein n=1 Tax=Thiorhodovibrio TaxID=61593 RepID=UPI001913BB27|nr:MULTISPECIES: hypothetical protein [Thiorhodovibrio]MBK5969028.1 hypothetical protein [Thiorhodovibrio winogradskyi]WPL15091.1 hypothetical protein Thiosp_04955 [Thiorhodovibrio litoralis]